MPSNNNQRREESCHMYVINRHNQREDVSFDKILRRIQTLAYGLHSLVDPPTITQNVINGVRPHVRRLCY